MKEITKTKNNDQSGECYQSAKSAQRKGLYQAANPLEKDINKNKKQDSPVCPLNGPVHCMNLCKVILEQAKSMKSTYSTACGGGTGRVSLQGAKKRLAEGEEMNALVSNAVKTFLKSSKRLKANASNDSGLEDEQEHFNFETLNIGE